MAMTAPAPAALNVLMLTDDPAWVEVAHDATAANGGTLAVAASAPDALQRLVAPTNLFSHFLLQPSAAGAMLSDLLGVTAAEAGSQAELVLLGPQDGEPRPSSFQAETPEMLQQTLAGSGRKVARPARLSAADLAVSFDPASIEVRFQPIVQLSDRRPVGVEALARMHHPVYGTLGPDWFVPQIEQAGLSLRLTEAVTRAAMAAMTAPFLDSHDLFFTINLPLDVLLFPESLDRIEYHRLEAGIPTSRILIELTESRPVSDIPTLAAAIDRWRSAGYQLAIDDMGPEMMNQLELFALPFNVVKLDKQIVIRSENDLLAQRYLQRTVDNAHLRSLSIIAEGIENQAMWVRMRDMGVQHAQGFLIARALPANALPVWLEAWGAQLRLPPDRG